MIRYGLAALLALSAWFIPAAQAQAQSCSAPGDNCNKAQAYAAAQAFGAQQTGGTVCGNATRTIDTFETYPDPANLENRWKNRYLCRYSSTSTGWVSPATTWVYVTVCPSGSYWDEASKTCKSSNPCPDGGTWSDAQQACISPECQAKPALVGVIGAGGAIMDGGCCYVPDTSQKTVDVKIGNNPSQIGGTYKATGAVCTSNQNPKAPKSEQHCAEIDGQTLCAMPDGRKCAKTSTGKYNCFGNGETGQKTDGPTLTKVDAGPNHTAPNLTLPSGDTLNKTGGPTTVTTTTTIGPSTTTNVTNISNYNTSNGTNAGGGNQGTDSPGDGEGEGDGNGATGGSCSSGWAVTGDALLGAILGEAHKSRCAGEKSDSDLKNDAGVLNGEAGGDEGNVGDLFLPGEGSTNLSRTEIVLGGGQCPPWPAVQVAGMSFQPPAMFCEVVAALKLLFIASAYAWALVAVIRN